MSDMTKSADMLDSQIIQKGSRGRCPICQTSLSVDPGMFCKTMKCPRCQAALWCAGKIGSTYFYPERAGRLVEAYIVQIFADEMTMDQEEVRALLNDPSSVGGDSFDQLEMADEIGERLSALFDRGL